MDKSDLRILFALTAAATVAVAGIANLYSMTWSMQYGAVAVLALVNWVALAVAVGAYAEQKLLTMVAALSAKLICLTLLIVMGAKGWIELTSFIAAVNTFFVILVLAVGFRALRSCFTLQPLDGSRAHG